MSLLRRSPCRRSARATQPSRIRSAEFSDARSSPFLVPKDIVRNVVVTIDNLPRKKTAVQRWPLKPTDGEFVVSGAEDVALSDANYARYAPLVKHRAERGESHRSQRCTRVSTRSFRKRTQISATLTATSTIDSSK